MSLLAKHIAIMSSFRLIEIVMTSEALSSLVDHFRDSYRTYSPYILLSSFFVQRQNFPLLLPSMNPLENGQMAVTISF